MTVWGLAFQLTELMTKKGISIVNANILIMGLTFKENCPDLRNSRVVDVIKKLESFECKIDVYDPWVNKEEARKEYGITPIDIVTSAKYDAILIAVAHNQFKKLSFAEIRAFGAKNHVLYDLKYVLKANEVDGRL